MAILAADMFERVELEEPRKALESAGAKTEIVSIHPGEIEGFDHFTPAKKVKVDKTVEEASASNYDALLVPGGVGNPDQLRGDENAVRFVRDFVEGKQPVAAICHAPWVLVEAGVTRGLKLTSWPTVQTDIRNAGGDWVDKGGRRRPGNRHEPQARRHSGLQQEDDRGVRGGTARESRPRGRTLEGG
jgi:protease I